MKKILLVAFGAWLMAIGKVAADNTLSVANVTIPQGGQATVTITCDFSTTFVGGQWDLELSEDGKLTPNMSEGKPVASFGFTGTDHSISSSQLKDGEQQLLPKYRFVFTSMSSTALPTSGTLMTIVLNADEAAEVGTVYNAKLSNIELGTSGSAKTNLDDILFTVTIAEPLATVTLNEMSTTAPTASEGAVNVTVNRTIKAGEWSTICLPFDMTADQVTTAFGNDVVLKKLSSWSFTGDNPAAAESITLGFTTATTIEKNVPCLIKVSSAISSFGVNNVMIAPETTANKLCTDAFVYNDGWDDYSARLYGVYAAQTKLRAKALFLSDNKFWYSTGTTEIKAYRGYLWLGSVVLADYNSSSSARVFMTFDDDNTTGISHIERQAEGNAIYNLNGQRMTNPAKGLYIMRSAEGRLQGKNGKKVIVK